MSVFEKYTDKETFAKIVDFATVGEMWANSVACYANDVAVVDGDSITYAQMDDAVAKMRTALVKKGIKKGSKVGVFAPNSAAFVKSFLALTTLGATAVLLPPQLEEMPVLGCTMKFGMDALIYAAALAPKTALLAAKRPDFTLIEDSATDETATPAAEIAGEDPAVVLFTGGTTGASKGALLSHKALMRGTKNGCFGIKEIFSQRYLLVLPLTHVFGLVRNLLTNFYTGSAIFICRNNKDMFRDIAMFRPTIMVMVPALAEMALNLSKQFKKNMLGDSMKTIICGASTVPPYLVQEYHKLGILVLPGYGLTESANLVSGNPESLRKPASVGFIYEGMDYKIVDGELWLKGVNMMEGYVGEPEANAASYEDGYFKTGDLVRIDEEGFLYIVGRKKELIVLSSGENISPAEIEARFGEIDAIQDCLVYENNENGLSGLTLEVFPRAAVLAAMQLADNEGYLKEEINKINATLPSTHRINKIVIRDTDFVRSPSMKIVRGQQHAADKN